MFNYGRIKAPQEYFSRAGEFLCFGLEGSVLDFVFYCCGSVWVVVVFFKYSNPLFNLLLPELEIRF